MRTGFRALCVALILTTGVYGLICVGRRTSTRTEALQSSPAFSQKKPSDSSGLFNAGGSMPRWRNPASLEEIRESFDGVGRRGAARIDAGMKSARLSTGERIEGLHFKASLQLYDGDTQSAYRTLSEARSFAESDPAAAAEWLYPTIFYQGVACLRRGEDENCVACRGDGACLLPLAPTATHKNPAGSRQAVAHFLEYLKQFPDDHGAKWLLNVACMTLGEHPEGVPPEHRILIDRFGREQDIGRFKDVAPRVGLDRFNMAGGAVMDDFDNDGLFDLAVTDWDAAAPMSLFRNLGNGRFKDVAKSAGLAEQLGGLNLVQADYDNDGWLDFFICRGAWMNYPMRPSLVRNNGKASFTDVTASAGVLEPLNSNAAAWADYDNDGFLDLFVCNETGFNKLYHNRRDGTFEEVAFTAGVQGNKERCKGVAWLDYDNDGWPDLFINNLSGQAVLYHNERNGTFSDVTVRMGITGPKGGFACWAFDYDNDGWIDLFATCYERTLDDAVLDLQGRPRTNTRNDVTRLFRNLGGKKFEDVSSKVGVDRVFVTMGANFGDFDNDGYLDFYLGTGDPSLATIIPNRMFHNDRGKRFAEITATAGTGHLQKGHGIACGDWDRDGNIDVFAEIGGATAGDRFRSAMFQNPGHSNAWITVKLVGKKTNRSAFGARIKVVASGGPESLIVHRTVGYGSSFGGNPLQQTIGIGPAKFIATLEVTWPTSGTTQVITNVAINQAIEITEFAKEFRKLDWKPIPLPSGD